MKTRNSYKKVTVNRVNTLLKRHLNGSMQCISLFCVEVRICCISSPQNRLYNVSYADWLR